MFKFLKLLVFFVGCALASSRSVEAQEPSVAAESATPNFWQHWGDGKAELSGYKIRTERYGQLREGHVVLIYVTEPMNRDTWIKDDNAPRNKRVEVLKLNQHLVFRTGIYPYSVLTSTFSPVDPQPDRERFAPVKIALSAQEWCGHVYQRLMPHPLKVTHEIRSYFATEGNRVEQIDTRPGTLYEDALLIQLRELTGRFTPEDSWFGELIPALWVTRKTHQTPRETAAAIRRTEAKFAGQPVTVFELKYGTTTRKFFVEKEWPHRVLGWQDNQGERAEILKTTRLPYWQLNNRGDERYLTELGLSTGVLK